MTRVFTATLWLLLVSPTSEALAQVSAKFEAGLGAGAGDISSGVAGRWSVALEKEGWGGLIRFAGHSGESTCDPCFLGIPNPELVRELAVLLRRGLDPSYPSRFSVGLGLGLVGGERADPIDPDQLVDIPSTLGVAFEALWDFGDRRGWGSGLAVQGNVNGESSFVGLVFFGSFRIGGAG